MKNKPAYTQLLIVLCIVVVSFFLIGAIGGFVLAMLSGMSLAEIGNPAKWDYSKPNVMLMVRGMMLIQFIGVFVVPSFLAAWMFGSSRRKYLLLNKPSNTQYYIAGIVVLLIALPLVTWLGELNSNIPFPTSWEKWMKSSEEEAQQTIKGVLSQRGIKNLVINVIFIAAFAGIGEELLFRGVLQRILTKLFKNHWWGIIVAAILFSALHMQFYGFIPRVVLGILLGIIYWYSGSLWPAIVAHFMYDAVLIIAAYYNPSMMDDDAAMAKTANLALAGLLSLALVTGIVWFMIKKSTTRYSEVYADDNKPYKNHPFDFEDELPR